MVILFPHKERNNVTISSLSTVYLRNKVDLMCRVVSGLLLRRKEI